MNTDARELALQYYQAAGRDMGMDLTSLGEHPGGVILLSPQLVVLMKPVQSKAPETWTQLEHIAPVADAWYVHLLVGNLAWARQLAASLPSKRWLCFHRGLRSDKPHRIPWLRFCNNNQQH